MNRLAFFLLLSLFFRVGEGSARAQKPTGHDVSAGQQELERRIIALEHRYWEAWKHKDAKTLAQLRAEDFREVDQDGMRDKKQVEQDEPNMEITDFKLKNQRVSILKPDVALLTYEVGYEGTYKGADISTPHAYVASVYQRRDGDWRLVYS